MAKVVTDDQYYKAIADAIREKDGSSAKMLPSEMASKIQNISQGKRRLIPTAIMTNNGVSPLTIQGSGILYLGTSNSKSVGQTKIDNVAITRPTSLDKEFDYNGRGYQVLLPYEFYESCTIGKSYSSGNYNQTNIAVIGNFTSEQLTGHPKSFFEGEITDNNITVTGKGYAILKGRRSSQYYYSYLNVITVDNIKIVTSNIKLSGCIRVDFNKSITINKTKYADYSSEVEIYVYD